MNVDKWISQIFDHGQAEGDWEWDDSKDPDEISNKQVIEYIFTAFSNYTEKLNRYSDWQLGKGFNFIFSNSCSDYAYAFHDKSIDVSERANALLSLQNIFKLCLDQRCTKTLGHLSESGNELNHFCYMVWDVAPIPIYPYEDNEDEIIDAVIKVMKSSLELKNIACIESGLHGLGHLTPEIQSAKSIIVSFIKENPSLDGRIITYAHQASTGRIL